MTDASPLFRQEYPFESQWLPIPSPMKSVWQYHYIDEGEGEPILFVHGNPTWSFAWRRLVSHFKATHRTVAVDHIGCGLSDKPQHAAYTLDFHVRNLCRLIEELDLCNITLVGHDWGGAIGMGAATRLPERFDRFVLMNTAAFRSKRIPWRIAVCRTPLLGAFGVRGLNLFSGAAMKMAMAHPERLTAAARDGYLHPYDSWKNRVAVQRFVEDIPLKPSHPSYGTLTEIEETLSTLSQPMALVWGMRDWCFSPHFLDEFIERFPNADVTRLDDAGHFVFEDEPQAVQDALTNALERG